MKSKLHYLPFLMFSGLLPLNAQSYDLAFKGDFPAGLHAKTTTALSFNAKMSMDMGQGPIDISTSGTGNTTEDLKVIDANSLTLETVDDGMVMTVTIPGMGPQKQAQPKPLQGTTLTGTREGGAWAFKLSDGEAEQEEIDSRAKVFNKFYGDDSALFGGEKRAVGDSWKVDAKAIGGFGEFDGFSGMGDGKLVSIEEIDGAKCGKVEITFSGKAENGELGADAEITIGGTYTLWRDLDLKIDRKRHFKGAFETHNDVGMDMKAPIEVTIDTKVLATGK